MRPAFPMIVPGLLALSLAALPAFGQDAAGKSPATITVNGESQVEIAPDMASVSMGVTNDADSAKTAMADNNSAVSALLSELARSGIDQKDIQTNGLSLGPRYVPNSSGVAETKGFTASNMVTVNVRDLGKLGGVLDAVVGQGANTLNGISFGLQDPQPSTDEARKKAVEDARRKATLYAEAAGLKLGPVKLITENGGGGQIPGPMYASAMARDAAAVPVSAGQVSVSASVTVVYELK